MNNKREHLRYALLYIRRWSHSKMKKDGFTKWATLMTLIYESNEPHTLNDMRVAGLQGSKNDSSFFIGVVVNSRTIYRLPLLRSTIIAAWSYRAQVTAHFPYNVVATTSPRKKEERAKIRRKKNNFHFLFMTLIYSLNSA